MELRASPAHTAVDHSQNEREDNQSEAINDSQVQAAGQYDFKQVGGESADEDEDQIEKQIDRKQYQSEPRGSWRVVIGVIASECPLIVIDQGSSPAGNGTHKVADPAGANKKRTRETEPKRLLGVLRFFESELISGLNLSQG